MEELKAKCEAMISELEEVKESTCYADGIKGKLKDVKGERLYHAINAAQIGLSKVVNTIISFYTEQ